MGDDRGTDALASMREDLRLARVDRIRRRRTLLVAMQQAVGFGLRDADGLLERMIAERLTEALELTDEYLRSRGI